MRNNNVLLLGLLTLIFALNGVDRAALSLLLQEIKTDLLLSDTQLGLLTGFAFAVFYSVMGIPIARWADRGDRITVTFVTTFAWSSIVALLGLAQNFIQLLLLRIGVAIGEAGCVPTAHSLLADRFSRASLPRVMSIYTLGGSLSILIGFMGAGWLNEAIGWRLTFVALGIPGLLVAIAARLLLKDNRAFENSVRVAAGESQQPRLGTFATMKVLVRNRTFRNVLLCFAVASFFAQGIAQWQPTFFIRSHGLNTGALGTWFALVYGLLGAVGTIAGGEFATRFLPNNQRLQLRIIALIYGGSAMIFAATFLVASLPLAFAFMGLGALVGMAAGGPLFAIIQSVVAPGSRATATAIVFFATNLIGMGFGPLLVGALSDALHPWLANESLRYALVLMCPGYIWCALYVWRAGSTVAFDLAPAETDEGVASQSDRAPHGQFPAALDGAKM